MSLSNDSSNFIEKKAQKYLVTAKKRASVDEFSVLLHVALFTQLGKQMHYPQDVVQSYRFTLDYYAKILPRQMRFNSCLPSIVLAFVYLRGLVDWLWENNFSSLIHILHI